jgi:hypothetical protein
MIKIDFHGSTHGHFLEYVSNVYIMQTAPSQRSIFRPPTYSAHNPDDGYLNNRIIECGHFSAPHTKLKINDGDQVIRIVIDSDNDDTFFIALTNLIFKAGDIGFEKQQLNLPDSVRNHTIKLRDNWYCKFDDRKKYANYYADFLSISNSVHEFKFESFFSFKNFCVELNSLATFLNQTFFPDQSLYLLWSEFIAKNQVWQSFIKCNRIIENIFANTDTEIDCTVIEQAWINYNLSKMCKIYDGALFEDRYLTNTQHVYALIQTHNNLLK